MMMITTGAHDEQKQGVGVKEIAKSRNDEGKFPSRPIPNPRRRLELGSVGFGGVFLTPPGGSWKKWEAGVRGKPKT